MSDLKDDTLSILDNFDHIISAIGETVTYNRAENVVVFKVKVHLVDGTNLRITRSRIDGSAGKYSFYWLDEQNDLLIGWDNAHEVEGLDTSPHHMHIGNQSSYRRSEYQNLSSVLDFITQKIDA